MGGQDGFELGDERLVALEVGSAVGNTDWVGDGTEEDSVDGTSLGANVVELADGAGDCTLLGIDDGSLDGLADGLEGILDGNEDGYRVGRKLGVIVEGLYEGASVGSRVGKRVGDNVGSVEGLIDGLAVSVVDGAAVRVMDGILLLGEVVDGLTDGLTVLGENVDIQLGKDDRSNDGQLDGSIDGLDGFLVLGGKDWYIIVGHDEVDDAMGLFVGSIVEEDSDEDPVELMEGCTEGKGEGSMDGFHEIVEEGLDVVDDLGERVGV